MKQLGMRDGDGGAILLRLNRNSLGEITVRNIGGTEVVAHVYYEDRESLIAMSEMLVASLNAVNYLLHKKKLKHLIEARIEELKNMDEEAGWDNPPAPSISDIPF
jgi:hypothetical protein